MRLLNFTYFLGALAVGMASASAQEAGYPSKPVTLVVPVAAGSSTDMFARFFAEQLAKSLNQAFVVEPIPGAGGSLGVAKVLGKPADGYTVLMGTSATNAANYSLFKSLTYTPNDFAPVACLYLLPQVVALRAGVPARTVAELVTYAKANPGKLTYGWASSTNKIGAELFKAKTGTDILGVGYKGPQQVITDILGAHIDMVVESAVNIQPHAASGAMRVLAVMSPTRLGSMPDVPTMEELGFTDAVMMPWVGAFMKAGTPRDAVGKLNAAFGTALASPEYAKLEARAQSQSFMCSPDDLGKFAQKEVQRWDALVKLAGIERQ